MNDELAYLQKAIDNGIIHIEEIRQEIELNERRRILKEHQYAIYQDNLGRWCTYLPNSKKYGGRKAIRMKNKKDLENALVKWYSKSFDRVTVREVFQKWAERKRDLGEVAKNTYDKYLTDFNRFFERTGFADYVISDITEDDIEVFLKQNIRDLNLKRRAFSNMKTITIGIFKTAKRSKLTEISISNFIDELDFPRGMFNNTKPADEDNVFTLEEERKIEEWINNHPTIANLAILLDFKTGLRIGELATLKRSDLIGDVLNVSRTEIAYRDRENKHVILEVRESTKGRDGRRKVIMSKEGLKVFRRILMLNPFGEYLFEEKGKRLRADRFSDTLKYICRKVGIKERSMHKIRKTYATRLINAGVDIKLIERQMGHTNIATTYQYYLYNDKSIDEEKKIISAAVM